MPEQPQGTPPAGRHPIMQAIAARRPLLSISFSAFYHESGKKARAAGFSGRRKDGDEQVERLLCEEKIHYLHFRKV